MMRTCPYAVILCVLVVAGVSTTLCSDEVGEAKKKLGEDILRSIGRDPDCFMISERVGLTEGCTHYLFAPDRDWDDTCGPLVYLSSLVCSDDQDFPMEGPWQVRWLPMPEDSVDPWSEIGGDAAFGQFVSRFDVLVKEVGARKKGARTEEEREFAECLQRRLAEAVSQFVPADWLLRGIRETSDSFIVEMNLNLKPCEDGFYAIVVRVPTNRPDHVSDQRE